jgi:hypothetical protein
MTQQGLGFGFDYLTAGAFNVLSKAGDVADEALTQLKAGTYDAAAWSKSMSALTQITMDSYAECAEKVFGPVFGGPFHSAEITVAPDPTFPRQVSIAVGGSLSRLGIEKQVIPDHLVTFAPEVLPPGATKFQVCVANSIFVGANYSAKIRMTKLGIAVTPPTFEDISVTVPL